MPNPEPADPLSARTPGQLAPLLQAAKTLDEGGRAEAAIAAYREIVVGRPPQSVPSVDRLVALLKAAGRHDEALRVMMDLAAQWEDTFIIRARLLWKRACEMAPLDPAPLLGLARAPLAFGLEPTLSERAFLQEGHDRLAAAGLHAEAAAVKAAAAFGPEDIVEHRLQCWLKDLDRVAESGRIAEAVSLADRVIAKMDRIDVRARLRDVYARCGEWAQATDVSRSIARALRDEGRVNEAAAEDARADSTDPTRPGVWMTSAQRSITNGRPGEALRALDRAISLASGPTLVDAWETVGLAAALEDDEGRLRGAAAAIARLDSRRGRDFAASLIDPRQRGQRSHRLQVPDGVASLEMKPRDAPGAWVKVESGTAVVPPGWELKVRMGGLDEEPGEPADLAAWPADLVADLDLSFSRMADADLVHVARFERLRRLSLDCVDMAWGVVPMDAKIGLNIANLFDDARGRGVTSAGIEHLAGLSDLRHLELGTSGIDDAALPHLAGLSRLEVLMLGRTRVQGHGLRHLVDAAIPLRELDLAQSRLTAESLETLAGFSHLRVLHLDGMVLDGPRLSALRHLRLHTLTVGRTNVGVAHLAELRGLRRLDLTATALDADGAGRLAAHDRLALLIVRETDLGDAGLLALARLPSLRRVIGATRQFSEDAISRAKAVNPRLVIECTGQMLDLHVDDGPELAES